MTNAGYFPPYQDAAIASSPSPPPPHKAARGYQPRPCRGAPSPGGSDWYSASVTAGAFGRRKAGLIHEPINRPKCSSSVLAPVLLRRSRSQIIAVPDLMAGTKVGGWGGGTQPSRPPLLHRLNIDQNDPENGVIIFPACRYGRVLTSAVWQISIGVISLNQRGPIPAAHLFTLREHRF